MITLITGGARSGKTSQALLLAAAKEPKTYLATAELLDDEMRLRAERHRAERGAKWETVEEPYRVAELLPSFKGVVVIDCLTLWLSNWLLRSESLVEPELRRLCSALKEASADVIMITNEVGSSIIPENAVARTFRDLSGLMNQRIAEVAEQVVLMVCGIPVKVK